ncbi:HNH endonuclease [Acrocarpospora catenulata]|uniref:HNH endonuclease n=1 Tax=Acrocarpospora catenulata TaxID=2836182 RepID=UPI001BD9B218|nr:HNH endonuclease [Acrocarpospora catenulata]
MAIGKRLRFQIFRRDNFACRYCGLTATAGAVLEVDHVKPRSEGGRDVPTNLVTACEGCNSGKSDVPLGAPVVADVPQADFRAVLAAREPREDEEPVLDPLTEWACEMEVACGLRWHVYTVDAGLTVRESHEFGVSLILAIACGYTEDELVAATSQAGEARETDLFRYLPERPDPRETTEEIDYYVDALAYLDSFIPLERRLLIWRVRLAAGDHQPTRSDLIRAAASMGHWQVVEQGRDHEQLRDWLRHLPDGVGSDYLRQAAARWDEANVGIAGQSAMECPNEVLELAVSLALGASVPG